MTTRLIWLSVLSALLCSFSARSLANVVSDFNSDLDGWTVVGNGTLS